jgi:NarL family two-component system sensor histidine kinase LiaS
MSTVVTRVDWELIIHAMKRYFSSLQWKLTSSYALATTLAVFALVTLTLIWIGTVIFYDQNYLSQRLSREVAERARSFVLPAVNEEQAASTWIKSVLQHGDWIVSDDPFLYFFNPADPQEFQLTILTPDAQILAESVPGNWQPEEKLTELIQRALAGETDWRTLAGREADGSMVAATPLIAATGHVEALFIAQHDPYVRNSKTVYFSAMLVALLPIGILIACGSSLVGVIFGALVARGLTRRIGRINQTAGQWSQGQFGEQVTDPGNDEVGQLSRRLNQMAEQIQALLVSRQSLAAIEERNRIARDLHDSAKQLAFALSAQLGAARTLLESQPQAAAVQLRQAEQLADTLRQELAALIHELRPPALQDKGLADALGEYAQTWSRQTGIPTECYFQNVRILTIEAEYAFYRMAQEALANIARHSAATQVDISLSFAIDMVTLDIRDNGRGFDLQTTPSGLGIKSMQERTQTLGGQLVLESAPGKGTRVQIQLKG